MDLIASGRECDVFTHGPGRVLRRSRTGRSLEYEARVMDHARTHGYPVPVVHEVIEGGAAMVLDLIAGPTMADALTRRPWTVGRFGRLLAELHRRLRGVPAPAWLEPVGGREGHDLLHLDLHPLNVLMAPGGPVVIDWANAGRGDGAIDEALTWVVMASASLPGRPVERVAVDLVRRRLVAVYLAALDRSRFDEALPSAGEYRLRDANVSAEEQLRVRQVVARGR